MATQLQTIRTEILETAGLASDDARFPSATLTRIVNRALRNLSAERDWPWNQAVETLTTVANTQGYTPDASWQKTLRLRYENRDLKQYQARDAAQFNDDTGAPVAYFVERDTIFLLPTPDGVYSVEHVYSAVETALSGDTDTPALPDRYIDWLVSMALIQVATIIRDTDLYSLSDRERRRWSQIAADEQRRTTSSMKVQARSDWRI
jgi:hypothetical protein